LVQMRGSFNGVEGKEGEGRFLMMGRACSPLHILLARRGERFKKLIYSFFLYFKFEDISKDILFIILEMF